uniref:Adhesion G protein-coupled receptor E8 n=1 Tax=Mastacembelus armatus TaxID=205130 RepID=A0A3Q3NMY8_9TELE
VCGPDSICINTPGTYVCVCKVGYTPTRPYAQPSQTNICIDIDECVKNATICGDRSNCTNSIGSYICTCHTGYRVANPAVIASADNPCIGECSCLVYVRHALLMSGLLSTDIDECIEIPGICGKQTVCTNVPGSVYCSCPDGFYPSTGVTWTLGVSFLSGVGPKVDSATVGSEGDGETGSVILGLSSRIVTAMYLPVLNETTKQVHSSTVGKKSSFVMQGAIFESLVLTNGMESLLSHQYFKTENKTEMYSDVLTAVLPSMENINLTEPVNFTIQHKAKLPEFGMVTCVYWENKNKNTDPAAVTGAGQAKNNMHWSVEGCWIFSLDLHIIILNYVNLNLCVCVCFWLNRICVIVGLFFFALAILTFLLCSWNPKINNTARLHLCINLALSQLLLLWNDKYVGQKLACKVMAGLLHFLVVASFVWMLLEALQLYLLVRRLSKVQVIRRDGLPKLVLYLVGYGVPFVIVGISALVYSDGYGATESCWLSRRRNFNWALTGPVIFVILNLIIFCATLWSLKPTLANMKSDVSQSKDTRLIVFKILAQFVILGCTWILGLYQSNLFFQVLFIFLNSQQGTFLYIVHCLLNKEVREEYIKWLTCSIKKDTSEVSPWKYNILSQSILLQVLSLFHVIQF